ncbi:MAG TPA: ferritin-like domain-containing protein [Jatrophihabitantaceae bacterium]|jgi:hypothetical protein|nr:ferritin-like domain-containing protein [Jatrophihabitantaceae bacterium]
MSADAVLTAWQQALATEQAADFGYSALGPKLADPAQEAMARTNQLAHQQLVVDTSAQLDAAGQTPVPPEADYQLPFPVTDAASARQLALRLEEASATAWRYVVAIAASATTSATLPSTSISLNQLRGLAVTALSDSAVRAVSWRRLVTPANPSVPFPGI